MFGTPSREAVCLLVLCILHCTLMSHRAVEGKSSKKSGKILIMEGKSKDMLIKLWTFVEISGGTLKPDLCLVNFIKKE